MRARLLPLLLTGLAPLALSLVLAAPATAHAQAAQLAQPVVDLLPPGEVAGDGRAITTLYVVAIGRDGQPLADFGGRVTAAEGDTGRLLAVSPGLFSFTWSPPAVNSARDIEITIRGKVAEAGAVTTRVPVRVVPSTAHTASLTANPAQVVLGQDSTATVTIQLTGGATETLDGADLVVEASSGTVANVTPLGRGQYSLLYTAPSKLFPHLALLTIADRRDPNGTTGALVLPLSGKTNFTVTGLPSSNILVRVAGREYGPVQADAQGNAVVPLVVPPGVREATVVSVLGDQRQESPLDLKVPVTPRVQLFPAAQAIAADGRKATTVRVLVAQPDGAADPAAQVSFTASAGSFGPVRHEGGGVYAADWTPAAQTRATTAQVHVSIADPLGDQKDSLEVQLLPARPESLALSTDPSDLSGKPAAVQALARVTGPTPRGVRFAASGLSPKGGVQDRGGGTYAQELTVGTATQGTVQAAVVADAGGNPLARVLLFPAVDQVVNDGQAQVALTVLTVDAQGYPVGNVPVALSVARGDAQLSASVTTDANGMAQTSFTAGRTAGLVVLQAANGGHRGAAGVLQLPAGSAVMDLPEPTPLGQAWDPLVEGVSLGGAPAVAVALPMPTAGQPQAQPLSGPIARLAITAGAPSVAPGGTIELVAEAVDESGRKATGRQLQVFANAGTVSTVEDLGDGRYRTRLVAPASGTDTIRVTMLSPESGVSGMLEVPVQVIDAWGVAAATATTDATVRDTPVMPVTNPPATSATTATVQQPKPARPAGEVDRPWLRASAGFLGGFYTYSQDPASATGALYGDRIAFGGDTTPAAGAAGLGLHARAWIPGLDFLGAQASFDASRYAVELADFDDTVIGDWVTETELLLLARYPLDLDRTRLHIGARAGVAIGDFMLYRQDASSGTPVLDYGPLVVPAGVLGGELGLDHAGRVFAEVGGTIGLNGGGGLYSKAVDGRLGVAVVSDLFLYGEAGWQARNTDVYVAAEGANDQVAGALEDGLTRFGGGIGWQL